ncbi:MAG TPA: chemotaxis protein CheW, partial [Polyangiaceae bacterium]
MATGSFGHSGAQSSGAAVRTGKGDAAAPSKARRTVCAFWIRDRCFGLDTSMVAEVVSIDVHIPVPLAPPAVQGIFNLRGEPLP